MFKKICFSILMLFLIFFVLKTGIAQALISSPPKNLSAVAISSSQVSLSWKASADNTGVIGYVIYRDGIQIISVTTGTQYLDAGLNPETIYAYTVSAYDEEGIESGQSDPVQVITKAKSDDVIPPSNVSDLDSINETQTSIEVVWTAPGDDGNVGTAYKYDLRISETSILDSSSQEEKNNWWNQASQVSAPIPSQAGIQQKTTITDLQPHKMYFLAIKTSDENNNWSNISNLDGATAFTLSVTEPVPVKQEPIIEEPVEKEPVPVEPVEKPVEKPVEEPVIEEQAPAGEFIPSIDPNISNLPYPSGAILSSTVNDKIYFIVNGQKRWIANPEVYVSYGLTPNTETAVSQEILDQYPTGQALEQSSFPEGTLITGQNDFRVYLIKPPYKRHIFNPDIFSMYGHFKWGDIKKVSDDVVDSYITSDLYRASNDYRVYFLEEVDEILGKAVKHHINMTSEKFVSRGYNWNQIFVVSPQEKNYYETGTDMTK